MLVHEILPARLAPASGRIRIDLAIAQAGHPLPSLHEQGAMILGDSRLRIEKWHPKAAFDAQPSVVRFAVLQQLLVGGVVEERLDFFHVRDVYHLDGVRLGAGRRHCRHSSCSPRAKQQTFSLTGSNVRGAGWGDEYEAFDENRIRAPQARAQTRRALMLGFTVGSVSFAILLSSLVSVSAFSGSIIWPSLFFFMLASHFLFRIEHTLS